MNARNILFYELEGKTVPCIIDYACMGIKSLFANLAKLESVLKFQLLDVERVKPDELMKFEMAILKQLSLTDVTSRNTDLQKLLPCLCYLQECALEIIREIINKYPADKSQDQLALAYWLELYRNTLMNVKYELKDAQGNPRPDNDSRRRYAFASSAILLTQQLVGPMKALVIPESIATDETIPSFDLGPAKKGTSPEETPRNIDDLIKRYKARVQKGGEEERLQPLSMEELSRRLAQGQRFVLVANSGLGKTTLLKELQCKMLSTNHNTPLPVYFHCNELLGVYNRNDLLNRLSPKLSPELTPAGTDMEYLLKQKSSASC